YLGKETKLTKLIKLNLKKFKDMEVEYLVKRFLGAIALGMFPNKEWDGLMVVNGGYILVKENGEIVCFHLFNEDIFRDYLLSTVKLETPSSSRHQFGSIFKESGETKIKLNLQIRFIK
ncbi:MAG: HpaII family restriction endonuclease, partial [Campylobacterota bacterium]|nr:HpaII family restriction endonuclease [Campylobacterota bacterium]